jgi:hypothetical protein
MDLSITGGPRQIRPYAGVTTDSKPTVETLSGAYKGYFWVTTPV